jgi:hypothetical protein
MFRAGTGDTAGQNFTPLGNKPTQPIILIVYLEFLGAKFTDLLLEKDLPLSASANPIIPFPAIHGNITLLPGGTFILSILFIRHIVTPIKI